MQYVINSEIKTDYEIRKMFPNISFPRVFTNEVLSLINAVELVSPPPPSVGELEVAYQDGTEIDSKGNRVIKWTVRDKTVEELEAERKASVPTQITPLQAKIQLLEMELLDEVEAMVVTDRKVSLYWNEALEIKRDHPTLLAMSTALGLSDEQLDEMFIAASKLS